MPWAAGKRCTDVIAVFALLVLLRGAMNVTGNPFPEETSVIIETTDGPRQLSHDEPSPSFPGDKTATTPTYSPSFPPSPEEDFFTESSEVDGTGVRYVRAQLPTGPRLREDTWSSNETSGVRRTALEAMSEGNSNGGGGGNTNVYIIAVIGIAPLAGAIVWCIRRIHFKLKEKKAKAASSFSTDGRQSLGSKKDLVGEVKGAPCILHYVNQAAPDRDMIDKRWESAPAMQLAPTVCVNPLPTKDFMSEKQIMSMGLGHYVKHTSSLGRDKRPDVLQAVRYPSLNRKLSPWEFPRSQLRLLEVLGEGNFGQVWKAEAHFLAGAIGPIYVAVKCIKENASIRDREDLLRELDIMKMLGPHPNVVTLLGCCTDHEPYYVIMEYVVRGKLLTYLRDHRSRRDYYNCAVNIHSLTSHDLAMFAYHVAKGMEYISSRGIVHRDLAARNILVDHNKVCKVADFGLSRSFQDRNSEAYEQKTKGALPIRWMAPESLYMNIFTTKSDVWAFGILLWETVTLGSTPYPGMGAREVIQMVREGYSMEQPHHCRPELYHVMRMCWITDPNVRPNFTQLRVDLGKLVERQAGYVDLDHFPDNYYYNLYYSSGERV